MQLRRLALLASLGLIASCGKESTGPDGTVNGSFAFTFGGTGISGTYSASGSFPTNSSQQPTTQWAAGEVVTADGETWVAAAVPVNSTTHNFAFIVVERTTAGTATVSSSCSSNCGEFGFLFQASNTTLVAAQTCFLVTGTITFTTISSTRAVGTFSGSGNCVSSPGNVTTTFTVTNGSFDVPLVTGVV